MSDPKPAEGAATKDQAKPEDELDDGQLAKVAGGVGANRSFIHTVDGESTDDKHKG